MKFSLVFDNSGDSIAFDAINPEVIEYYVEQLTQHNCNSFWVNDPDYAKNLNLKIDGLHTGLTDSNLWLEQLFDIQLNTFEREDYLDQKNLNYLHAAWVNTQSLVYDIDQKRKQHANRDLAEQIHNMYPDSVRFPMLSDVINKIGKKSMFDQLNQPYIHGIESSFTGIIFKCFNDWVEFSNPFSKTIACIDRCNLFLPFNHLGRTQLDKFINFDLKLEHDDENTFNELIGYVGLSLIQPQKIAYSKEYLEWCSKVNREPSGELIPLGNIPDLLTNLTKYRIIVLRNTTARNNFYIDLNKG